MDVRPIDPRDTAVEVTSPTYRVYFWQRLGDNGHGSSFTAHEYEIANAEDVREVLESAEANFGERTFTAYVVVDETLVRLLGRDPTACQ